MVRTNAERFTMQPHVFALVGLMHVRQRCREVLVFLVSDSGFTPSRQRPRFYQAAGQVQYLIPAKSELFFRRLPMADFPPIPLIAVALALPHGVNGA